MGREGDREGEEHRLAALTGDWTCNAGMCPDQNRTYDLSVCGMMPKQLSHTSQGSLFVSVCFQLQFTLNIILYSFQVYSTGVRQSHALQGGPLIFHQLIFALTLDKTVPFLLFLTLLRLEAFSGER